MLSQAGSQPIMANVSRSPPSWPFQLVIASKKCFPGATLGVAVFRKRRPLSGFLNQSNLCLGLSAKFSSGAPAARVRPGLFHPELRGTDKMLAEHIAALRTTTARHLHGKIERTARCLKVKASSESASAVASNVYLQSLTARQSARLAQPVHNCWWFWHTLRAWLPPSG